MATTMAMIPKQPEMLSVLPEQDEAALALSTFTPRRFSSKRMSPQDIGPALRMAMRRLNNSFFDDASSRGDPQQERLFMGCGSASSNELDSAAAEVLSPATSLPLPSPSSDGSALSRIYRRAMSRMSASSGARAVALAEAFDAAVKEFQEAPLPRSLTPHITAAVWETQLMQLIEAEMVEQALTRPGPWEGMVRCYVKRVRSFLGSGSTFQMHLERGGQFLLAARKRKKGNVTSYIISQDSNDLKRDSPNCIAKLKANFVGTEYQLKSTAGEAAFRKGRVAEELCVSFKLNSIASTGGPIIMNVAMPSPEPQACIQGISLKRQGSISQLLEQAKRKEMPPGAEQAMAMLCSQTPEWDKHINGYALDFKGRVNSFSVKNCQLVTWHPGTDQRGQEPVFQFGRAGQDHFILDFSYPLSIKTAFAIALAQLDTKLCYMLG